MLRANQTTLDVSGNKILDEGSLKWSIPYTLESGASWEEMTSIRMSVLNE